MAGLHFDITAENKNFLRRLEEVQRGVRTASKQIEQSGMSIEQVFDRLTKGAAAFGAGFSAKELVSKILHVRGEMQQLEIAFSTMLQSKGKADKLMAEIVDFAAKTPFDLQGVANGAKQLLAYGSAADEVMKELKMMGDVAAGVSAPIGDLIYLFGTLKAQGRATTIDIRQFAGRGIPIYEELNKILGTTTAELNKMITEGKVGFPEVQRAFENMTSEGGKYFNLMQEQSKSWTGQLSNIGDTITQKLNDLGKEYAGAFEAGIGITGKVVEHLDDLVKIIGTLVGVYGAYKAAIIITTAAQKAAMVAGNVKAWFELAKGITTAKDAQIMFNLATKANPLGLLLGAIAAVSVAYLLFKDRVSAAEAAQKQLNKEREKAIQKKQELTSRTESLITKINSETESVYAQIKAYKELAELFPELKGMTFEEFKAMPQTLQKSVVDDMADKKELEDAIRLYEDDLKEIERINKKLQELSDIEVNETTSLLYEKLGNQLEITKKLAEGHKAQIEEIKQTQWEANTPVEEKVKHYEKLKESLEAERRALYQQVEPSAVLKSSVEGMNAEWGKMPNYIDKIKLDILNKQLDETTGKIKSLTGKGDSSMLIVTKNKAHWEEQKKNAVTALEAIDSRVQAMLKTGNKTGAKTFLIGDLKKTEKEADAIVKTYTDSVSKLNEANNNLKVYDFSDKTKNDLLKSQSELSRSLLDSDLKLQEMRLSIMEDGRQKRLKQSELEYKQQKAAIDKEYQDTVQKYKDQHKPVPNSVKTTYEARLGANNAAKVARDNRIEDDYLNERKEHEAALTAYLLTEEDKRKKAIRDRYDAEREWAKKQFEGENMTEEEYKAYSAKIDTAEAEDSLNELLEKYQSYTDKRLRIEQDFEKQRKELEKSGASQETLDEVDYQREEALKAVDEEFASRQEEYQGWCNQIANLSLEQLMLLLEQAKTELDKMENSGVSDNKLATQRAKVNKLQEQIGSEKTSTTPEKRSIEQWQKLHKTLSDVKGEFEDIGASVGGVAGEFLSAAGDIAGSAISMIDGIVTLSNSSAMAMQGTAAAAATSISMVEKASVILAVISAALQIATKIASLIKGKSKSELDAERMEAVTNRIADSEKIINSYIEKRIDLIKQATREEQKYLAATTKQSIANQRSYYENLFKSLRGNDLLSKEGKNNNLTAEQLGIRSIEDLKKFFDSERLQSFLRKGYDLRDFDKWKEIVDANDALANKEKDLAENTAKNLTGITLDDAQSALDEFLKNADTSMEDVAGSFENYMRDAMLGIVKQNTLNKALEDWYNHFEQAMDSGEGLDETEVKNLQQEYENAFTTAQQSYESMLKAAGMSLESDSSGRQATEKGIASMSQDSANELNGNFNALLIYSNKTAENTSSLRESMNYILEIQRAGWGDVRAIKELTSQMRVHTEKISELSEMIESNTKKAATGIDTLNTKGIYLKK